MIRATTQEEANEIWDKRKTDLLKLHGELARVAWDFCKIDIMNFMDVMGHPLNPADIDRIIRQELHTLADFLLRDEVVDFLKKQADKEYIPMFRECVESWDDGRTGTA